MTKIFSAVWAFIKSILAGIAGLFKKKPSATGTTATVASATGEIAKVEGDIKASWLWVLGRWTWLAAKGTAIVLGLRAALNVAKTSYRQPSILVIYGAIAVAAFLLGGLQESIRLSAASKSLQASTGRAIVSCQAGTRTAMDAKDQAQAALSQCLAKQKTDAAVTPAPKKHSKAKTAAATKAFWQ